MPTPKITTTIGKIKALAAVSCIAVFAVTCVSSPVAAEDIRQLPLYSWFSAARGDFFTTTDSAWTGTKPGSDTKDDYVFMGLEGYVLHPSVRSTAHVVPLYHWWSASREDNFLTSDPAWSGAVGDVKVSGGDSYRMFRIEGKIFVDPLAGTIPLNSYWDSGRGDNAATSKQWMNSFGRQYRREGFIIAPDTSSHWTDAHFMEKRPPEVYGYGALERSGTQPLLTILTEAACEPADADCVPFIRSADHYTSLLWGPAQPNLSRWLLTNSGGRFKVANAGVIGPLRLPRNNLGAADALRVAVESGLVDLARFDFESR